MTTNVNNEETARKLRKQKRAEYCESEEYKQIKEEYTRQQRIEDHKNARNKKFLK